MSNVYWLLELEIQLGQSDNLKQLMHEMIAAARENEPGTLNYEWTMSADDTICHTYERYADSGAVMTHLATFGSPSFHTRFPR